MTTTPDAPIRKKLIEVSIPLEDINTASARENFIYKGNPSSVHKWWAQRPLAAARAVRSLSAALFQSEAVLCLAKPVMQIGPQASIRFGPTFVKHAHV